MFTSRIEFNDNAVGKMRKDLNSACFVQVNHLLPFKTYEKTSGELTFGRAKRLAIWPLKSHLVTGLGLQRPKTVLF